MEGCTYRTVLACFSVLLSIHCSSGQTSGYNVNNSCPENVNLNNVTLVERVIITHPMYDDVMYYLYKINESALTWCESYKVCEQIGQRLAVLDTKDIQQTITTLNMSDIGTIWIAGRRKDYGSDWTWINDTLTDLLDNTTVYDSNNAIKDCGRIILTRTGQLETTADNCALLKQVICVVNGQVIKISNTLSWYNAINLCINKGSRLATRQDVTNIDRDGNSYWFGLHRRPWIWIDSDEEVHPVFYSSWLSTSGGNCIGMLSNGLWMATQCNKSLQYIICEEHTPPTTETSIFKTTDDILSENVSDSPRSQNSLNKGQSVVGIVGSIFGVTVAASVVIIVIILWRKGIISKDNKYLLMENASLGNMEMYLKKKSGHSYYNAAKDNDLPMLMNFIHQIIAGVKSVNELQPPALFYSLSASNVLITNPKQCKLTGFATSTAVTEREKWEEEHHLPRPIRWLAPEAIKLHHTRESDIWSLGVLLWQITNQGERPLAAKTDEEAIQLILNGYRLLKPLSCTEELYYLICNCLMYQPTKRPSINDVELQFLQITQYEAI